MKRIVLHCGLPKTGSSALQVFLAQNRGNLLEKGIDYLPLGDYYLGLEGKIGSGNGVSLARAFLQKNHEASLWERRGEIMSRFEEQIFSASSDVLLSSEFFSTIAVDDLSVLVNHLIKLGNVELMYFTRNQISLLCSSYIQRVKRHGLTKYPEEYFSGSGLYDPSLAYYDRFSQIQKACEGTELKTLLYEESKTFPGGLIAYFLSKLGVSMPYEETPESIVNTSLSPTEIRLMIELNTLSPRMQFSDMLVNASSRSGRSKPHSESVILSPEIKQAIAELYGPQNELYFANFHRAENKYSYTANDENYVDLAKVQFGAGDMAVLLGGVLVDLDRRLAKLEGQRS